MCFFLICVVPQRKYVAKLSINILYFINFRLNFFLPNMLSVSDGRTDELSDKVNYRKSFAVKKISYRVLERIF